MKHGLSISLRLTLWFSAIFLCGFIAFGALLLFTVYSSISESRDQKLDERADRMVEVVKHAYARKNPSGLLIPNSDGSVLQAYSLDGRVLTRDSLAAARFPWPSVPAGKSEFLRQTTYNRQLYHVSGRITSVDGTPVYIFVARRLTDNPSVLDRPASILIRSILVMLLVSALAGYFVSRRALMPVVHLTESARSITIGNLAARLPVSPSGDELARLAETCNEMLDRLEEAIKSITRFTADASHELRSPIAFIRATSEYTLNTPGLDAGAQQAFADIVHETDHALRLLEDMLLLARFDAGRASLAFEPVYLAEIVQSVVGRMRVLALEKQQRLTEQIADVDLELQGDPLLLRQLVWILVDNAIKYTGQEGAIEVGLDRVGQRGHLRVSDNGSGIPVGLLPHVFDRFFRADPSRSEQDGTGLGLAIAKQIAETHGATIAAQSNRGAGSIFEVVFPLRSGYAE
ncbi:MAG TPA: ATP-binding protein [Acidobacteriaceae bacterium]|nr:ATP-binding protein [Acidobacteriaceae bacterium]